MCGSLRLAPISIHVQLTMLLYRLSVISAMLVLLSDTLHTFKHCISCIALSTQLSRIIILYIPLLFYYFIPQFYPLTFPVQWYSKLQTIINPSALNVVSNTTSHSWKSLYSCSINFRKTWYHTIILLYQVLVSTVEMCNSSIGQDNGRVRVHVHLRACVCATVCICDTLYVAPFTHANPA